MRAGPEKIPNCSGMLDENCGSPRCLGALVPNGSGRTPGGSVSQGGGVGADWSLVIEDAGPAGNSFRDEYDDCAHRY